MRGSTVQSMKPCQMILKGSLTLIILLLITSFPALSAQKKEVNMPYTAWKSGWFQAEIYKQLIEELGYTVNTSQKLEADVAYKQLESNQAQMWSNGWFPIDFTFIKNKAKLSFEGEVLDQPILNGYLIDNKTAKTFNIRDISDFQDPKIAQRYDFNKNGKADLLGCQKDWHCHELIEYQLKKYNLSKTVEQLDGNYEEQIKIAQQRLKTSQPVLAYFWDTHHLVNEFQLSRLSFWLPLPEETFPEKSLYEGVHSKIDSPHCLSQPCFLGFPPSTIRPVLNKTFANHHTDIRQLLNIVRIPKKDIVYQNIRFAVHDENSAAQIKENVSDWIALSRSKINRWIQKAKQSNRNIERPIRIAQPTWESEWVLTEIIRILLQRMGYEVEEAQSMGTAAFFKAVYAGDIDFWTASYYVQNRRYYTGKNISNLQRIEFAEPILSDQVIQGYLIDKKHAEQFKIKTLADFKRPEVVKAFDLNGNGKADLMGCDEAWVCDDQIDYQLADLGLTDTVEQLKSSHSTETLLTLKRLHEGKPILIYAWTPHWMPGEYQVGTNTFWLPLPRKSLPEPFKDVADSANVAGCLGPNPCRLGLPVQPLRSVINKDFANAYPDIRALLKHFKMSLNDINQANLEVFHSEDGNKGVHASALKWLNQHAQVVEQWLKAVKPLKVKRQKLTSTMVNRVNRNKVLNVIARPFEPFVIMKDEKLTGFSIELWNAVASELGFKFKINTVDSTAKLLDQLEIKSADIGVSNAHVTLSRESSIDYSHAYLKAGLQIMVRENKTNWWQKLAQVIFSRTFITVIISLVLILLIAAHIIWLIERKHNPDEFPNQYFRGIFESLWWAGAIMTGREGWGKRLVRGKAKMFTFAWMFTGYFIFIYFTASMTTLFTISELQENIKSIQDLNNKKVATVQHSTAEEYLLHMGFNPIKVKNIQLAYQLLEKKDIDAIVYYAPVLKYHTTHMGLNKTKLVGKSFDFQKYGFALPANSPLRDDINKAMLKVVEKGIYDKLYLKWFGEKNEA